MDSDPSLAMNELNSAKKLNLKDPKILVAIGQVYFRQNKYQEAIESFEKALQLDKNYVVAFSNLGYTYEEFKKAVELKNNYAVAHYNLGLSLLGLENFDHVFVEF